jgi:pyridoxamine 5'-phosphate oxidase
MSQSPPRNALDEAAMAADPIVQFQLWMAEAVAAGLPRPDAMALATATPDGRPSVRMVLLKGCDQRGFVFYTNYRSRKGQELALNAHAATVFYWPELERQVRIEGQVNRVTPAESAAYFQTRPPDSRLSAVASPQSEVVKSRRQLEQSVEELSRQYPDGDVPCPNYWGGFRLAPTAIEFWQGQPGRLHDRLRFDRGPNQWIMRRLAP